MWNWGNSDLYDDIIISAVGVPYPYAPPRKKGLVLDNDGDLQND